MVETTAGTTCDRGTIQGSGGASDEMAIVYEQPNQEVEVSLSSRNYDDSTKFKELTAPEMSTASESHVKSNSVESIVGGVCDDVLEETQVSMIAPTSLDRNTSNINSTSSFPSATTMGVLGMPENSSVQHSMNPNSTMLESDAGDRRVVLSNGSGRALLSTTTTTTMQSKKSVLTGFRVKKNEKLPIQNLSATSSSASLPMGSTNDGMANAPMDSNTTSTTTTSTINALGNQNQSFRTIQGINSSSTSPIIRPINLMTGGQSMTRPISVAGAAGNLKHTNQQIHRPQTNSNDGGHNMIRELKVEDALQYLDQVKLEFGDNPTIYNTFLEIMKQFKSQELDTPGVIKKVSTLFRGYNKLILGFNTFLPDGYKIELKDLENLSNRADDPSAQADAPPRNQKGNLPNGSFMNRRPQHWPSMDYETTANKQNGPSALQSMLSHDSTMSSHPMAGRQSNIDRNASVPSSQGRQVLGGHQPRSEMVSPLTGPRQGHTMLPTDSKHMISTNTLGRNLNTVTVQPAPQQHRAAMTSALQAQQPPVEFDAAIAYVTTIKQRFAKDPRTYQAFLEILHTYQQEQRGIREVLEQVSALFSEHPDLLREFAHFLPEAVQEQAREKLQRAASEAEARIPKSVKSKVNSSNKAPHQPPPEANMSSQGVVHPDYVNHTGKSASKPSVIDISTLASSDNKRKFTYSTDGYLPSQTLHQPDSSVYNAGVERQFFDQVKEALTSSYSRNGETAWIEFRKCLDTYTQEIITRSEMLSMMEDLLGKKHADLFEEFKFILTAAGSTNSLAQDDSWHSVPLSEIEFNRCRRCTPSYRALPRDYPNPPCSDRCEEEIKVLNDVWVSLPVGSEENTRFRHMRKNQYEEILFRCEDERFEIDMVIDSNLSTLHRLEPIAEEILFLQQQYHSSKDHSALSNDLVFQYSLDPSILSTIHRNCITRIYGDAGAEMLELLLKNPAVVVPIVVKRLRQKDKEFRDAKEVLSRRWKDLAEANYFKSVDHRSLTWRAGDKRATSTRSLLTDIKDRAANNGNESESSILARREKAKEEHGAFYDVTMGRYLARANDPNKLPRPSKSLFTPHYFVCYDNISWAQQDACRILLFMIERGSTSPVDKERCYKLWRDLLAPFFGLSLMWMHSPAAKLKPMNHLNLIPIAKRDDDNDMIDDRDISSFEEKNMIGNLTVKEEVMRNKFSSSDALESSLLEHQPIPIGAHLSTLYGEGTLVEYRRLDRIYIVTLSFGATAFLRPSAVLCSVLHPERSSITEELRSKDPECLPCLDDSLCFGPQSLYIFFRLHHMLIQRLIVARNLAYSVDNDASMRTIIEKLPHSNILDYDKQRYGAFLSLLYSLAEGGPSSTAQGLSSNNFSDGVKYEDRVRSLLGHGAYELTTMDKLLSHIVKNLQVMANDDSFQSMIQVFRRHLQLGSFKPTAFRQEIATLSEGENIYAFQYSHLPRTERAVLYMEFWGSMNEVVENEKSPVFTHDVNKRKTLPDVIATDKENPKRSKT